MDSDSWNKQLRQTTCSGLEFEQHYSNFCRCSPVPVPVGTSRISARCDPDGEECVNFHEFCISINVNQHYLLYVLASFVTMESRDERYRYAEVVFTDKEIFLVCFACLDAVMD